MEASVKVDSLVEFFESDGHNLIAFGDLDARRHLRNLALNFGIDFQPFVSESLRLTHYSIMNLLTSNDRNKLRLVKLL